MLKIHDPTTPGNLIPFPIENDKRYVTHVYDGMDTLTFEISQEDSLYGYLVEEVRIDDEKNRYVVKTVDERSDFVTIRCDLDLEDWKRTVLYEFRAAGKTLAEVLQSLLPEGWVVEGASVFSQRTTVEKSQGEPFKGVTPLEVLPKVSKSFGCVFNFEVFTRTLKVIDPSAFQPSGQFFTDELNLKDLGFTGTSKSLATRLYAYGKKSETGTPLTFESINGGKPYVEDLSYCDRVISVGWTDERYTDPESLLQAAKDKLKQLSHPERSYSCKAQHLDEPVWLYKVVTLIDRKRQTRVDHQIVEFVEYPDHTLDKITLSTSAPSIQSYVDKVLGQVQEDLEKTDSSLKAAVANATEKITGNKGGHFAWVFDSQGRPVEFLNLCDSDSLDSAKSLWRWNASGLGHSSNGYGGPYSVALLDDGSINASMMTTGILLANLIQAGILQSVDGKTFYLDLDNGILRGNFSEVTINGRSVSVALGNMQSSVDKVEAKLDDTEKVTEQFRVTEEGMTISNTATGMGIGVSEERVVFTGGNNPTTIIRPNDMETTNLRIGTRLDLGGFAWIPRTNKNLSLRWIGG